MLGTQKDTCSISLSSPSCSPNNNYLKLVYRTNMKVHGPRMQHGGIMSAPTHIGATLSSCGLMSAARAWDTVMMDWLAAAAKARGQARRRGGNQDDAGRRRADTGLGLLATQQGAAARIRRLLRASKKAIRRQCCMEQGPLVAFTEGACRPVQRSSRWSLNAACRRPHQTGSEHKESCAAVEEPMLRWQSTLGTLLWRSCSV